MSICCTTFLPMTTRDSGLPQRCGGPWGGELVARVTGPVVLQLQAVFLTDFFLESNMNLQGREFFPNQQAAGSVAAQALPSGPGFPQSNSQRLIVSLLYAAQRRVVITTPYF